MKFVWGFGEISDGMDGSIMHWCMYTGMTDGANYTTLLQTLSGHAFSVSF